ncbi:MAG: hypothetical protein PHQ23_15695 [Candidatus Wallbacteria bacterium]|nr:hypothetical protein [Candidatus Wallbacteria bacterium]
MKTIMLNIEDSIFDTFLAFLELFPRKKVKVVASIEELTAGIPFVSDEEHEEIAGLLKNRNCHQKGKSRVVRV